MLKAFFILLLGLLFFQTARAQKKADTLLYLKNHGPYRKEFGKIVENRGGADYLLHISMPADSSSGIKLDTIREYYPNNMTMLSGTATVSFYQGDVILDFFGPCIEFYPNGKKKTTENYKDGILNGDLTTYYQNGKKKITENYKDGKIEGGAIEYYPNGNLYAIEKYEEPGNISLIECHDSTGKVMAANGIGNWVKFDLDNNQKIEAGPVKDYLEEGEWQGFINDSVKYTRTYHKGKLIPTTDTIGQIYASADREPEFIGGIYAFFNFCQKNIQYPRAALEQQIQGKVIISYVVEKDGSLTNIRVLRGPAPSLNEEAIRVIKLSPPWVPGILNNKPVRTRYVIPISFNLGD